MKALTSIALALLSVSACKGKETKSEESPPKAPPVEAKPVEAAPVAKPVEAAPVAPTATNGAFASIEAWCRTKVAAFEAACKDASCFCDRGDAGPSVQMSGPAVATGTSTMFKAAAIVRVADKVAKRVQCGIAAQTADGWRFYENAFECGDAPSTGGEGEIVNATVEAFTLSDQALDVSAVTEISMLKMDEGGHALPSKSKQVATKLTCKMDGTTLACTKKK